MSQPGINFLEQLFHRVADIPGGCAFAGFEPQPQSRSAA